MQDRERLLRPIFQQVALRFADLHDTPQRMAAKGVIAGIVPWEQSRAVFYRRLRRRLAEVGHVSCLEDVSLCNKLL